MYASYDISEESPEVPTSQPAKYMTRFYAT